MQHCNARRLYFKYIFQLNYVGTNVCFQEDTILNNVENLLQ